MSLIEQTLLKEKQRAAAATPAARAPAPQAPRARAPAQPAPRFAAPTEVPERKLKPASADPVSMELFGVLLHSTDQAALRAYKILRTQLLRKLEAETWSSLAVTAVGVGDGKTVTALNLAITLARDVNTRVALVDLDLQRPAIARYLGLQADLGIDAYLAGKATLEDIYYDIGVERLAIVPTLNSVTQASDLLTSPRMMELLEDLRQQHRIVIFDLPPMLLGDDVLALAPHADGVLLVVGEGTTARAALEGARSVLAQMNIAGVVLNRSAERDDTSYY